MQVTFKIKRYNPETDSESHWESYQLDVDPKDRILDALLTIKRTIDGTLTFRYSCAHGVCGSDAVMINGINQLACQTLVQDLKSDVIKVEPVKGMEVLKDLVTDFDPFFEHLESVKPYLINNELPPSRERHQSIEERERFDDTTKCIMCGICTTACPSFWTNGEYIGPAAFVNAHRFVFDSRDEGAQDRLEILNDKDGVWRCHTIFNCTDACPREINVTQAIAELKNAITFSKV
ncbi:MAG: succinate dehydrogenase iron-sulfur subunit [Candidatus Marinimicrobia bacterium]|nr:succinate dehydrogenase iron-sulfur subunit [Candidatus Neomarinimicrobiota bacterium]MCF7827998.1 succinate dehydrogenase iron-sulfur subunit [Candidatus Neomarinimicrobiota bacterium]MCF7879247.1 succinate dehydrogenase iron-sulfur subunit [Candidatus Neomarinimicrobiota bacterium]